MVPGIVPDALLGLALLALFDAVALSPVLFSGAVRRLVTLWPTDSLALNYLTGASAYAVTHLTMITIAVALHGGRLSQDVLQWLAGTTLLNALGWWVALAVVLPIQGGWQPKTEGEYDGRIALTLGLVGYVIATGVGLLIVLVVAIALYFPG